MRSEFGKTRENQEIQIIQYAKRKKNPRRIQEVDPGRTGKTEGRRKGTDYGN